MNTFSSLLAAFRQGSARRSAAHALRSLPAAQLADLGIPADAIDDVVEAMLARPEQRPVRPWPAIGVARAQLAVAPHGR